MSDTQRVYELGYLLLPTLSDERAVEVVAQIKKFIADNGGEEIAEGASERIDLAYPMLKVIDNKNIRVNEAHFGWYKFAYDPSLLAALKGMLDTHGDLIRHLLFKTVRENTYIVRKGPRRRTRADEPMADDVVDEEIAVEAEALEEAPIIDEPTESELLDTKIESLIPDTEL